MVKGKMREEKVVEDEYIELPDIDSEYSEEDDVSEHERKEAKLPDWAQSPALKEALANQRKVNPDDVFGGTIPPPRMDGKFFSFPFPLGHKGKEEPGMIKLILGDVGVDVLL
jgi:hypothetical protein